ncbi:hypothetical protein QBC39DRAFT_368693 [Podospora conica]|nr:hypothetical protein QBC39DRAFT_368693 [Schizothecium conicum]
MAGPPEGGDNPTMDMMMRKYQNIPLLNQRSSLLALTIFFIVFSWLITLARLYVRCIVKRAPGWDDLFLVLAMISTTIGSVYLCILTNLGLGTPIVALEPSQYREPLRGIFIATATYPIASTFIKVALLLQYLRVLEGRRIRILCKVMLLLSIMAGVGLGVVTWFSCLPVAAFWDMSLIPIAKCWGFGSRKWVNFRMAVLSQVVVTALMDLIVFCIPLRLYFQPGTTRATRISLLGLFFLGVCTNLCSVFRVVYVAEMEYFDPLWDNPMVMGLASYEMHMAAVCSALPVLWPVIKETWNRIFVTQEVTVTHEFGVFVPKKVPTSSQRQTDAEAQSVASDQDLVHVDTPPQPKDWNPFVGDEKTGLGESETVVESQSGGRWARAKRVILGDKDAMRK